MDQRLYPVTPEFFARTILPLIEGNYIWKGRPPSISHYQVFCAILYVLRVGCPWRDLPVCYGNWHSIYEARLNAVLADSTSWKVHRHGGGSKGGTARGAEVARA